MKALVTGATGFIGSHLAEALAARGYDVTVLTRKTSRTGWLEGLKLNYIASDLSDIEASAGELRGFDYVFHVAGLTKTVRESDFFRVNTEYTSRLLKVLAEQAPGMKRFIYLSSLAAAGPSLDGRPVREDSPPLPVSAYGRSKLLAEEAVRVYQDRLPTTIIRPPAVFGPRDTDFLVMFKMIKKHLFPFWGECSYSMVYVADLVQGIILAAEHDRARGKTYNLAHQMIYTNRDIAGEISAALGVTPLKIRLPRSLLPVLGFIGQKIDKKGIINRDRVIDFGFTNWTCDTMMAEHDIGFRAKTTLREGIQWTADWYRTHQWI
ncbi:MAG: NAD-dependent epimerase/dehydratase family protein [Thermodesulfovibrionales bacterium]